MTNIEDRPSIGERYTSAIESSNLKLGERRGDVDLVIAAGLVPDGLAAALYRLQVEYDAVRAEHQAAERRMRDSEKFAERQSRDDAGAQRTKAILEAAEGAALTAHVLILSQLSTLRTAKDLFGRFAVVQATKQRFMRPDRDVLVLAGRVLDVMLAPNCRHCDGRGFNGGGRHEQSTTQTLCRPCRGSGSRRDDIGRDDAERRFASHLQMECSALISVADRDLRTGLRRVAEAKLTIAEAGS